MLTGPWGSEVIDQGDEQASQTPLPTRHSKDAPGSPDIDTVAVAFATRPAGAEVIEGASGATVSTSRLRPSLAPVLPAVSVWRTSRVCWPSEGKDSESGDPHDAQAPPSVRHSTAAPGSPVKLTVRLRVA